MFMYPPFYDLYRPKPPPSEMIIEIAERRSSLPVLQWLRKMRRQPLMKLEKLDATAKLKVIKEVKTFTNLGMKEVKDVLVEKITKDEGNDKMEKIKGGVSVME
ncbi:39S RIBOSOMAL PROTEIN L12 [Salix purpurea]|uniref:39S RIBOSOMAL PROTEIN L12 n=1 Tax=Salix purpurea TaxID=77065 RepID=A0A9Q0VHQ9_SALPP|nr:39S RIBOSOMAL PROTEIN L12 [Salix purpurea]